MNKDCLRQQLAQTYHELWQTPLTPLRAPLFANAAKAAENLRRLPAYQMARNLAITSEPALLQARINALLDGKNLLVATPGLKQGLVRLTAQSIPIARRHIDLQAGAMFKAGKPLPLPRARLGKVDMLISTALAVDENGVCLGDGRGMLDLFCAILTQQDSLEAKAPLVLLLHEKQMLPSLPQDSWDVKAQLVLTAEAAFHYPAAPRLPLDPSLLTPVQLKLPIIKAITKTGNGRAGF